MNKSIKSRLIVMNLIQWAVWGAYLTSMGSYLASVGLATRIGIFYAMQGIVSIFMPTLMGIVADKFIPAQRLLGLCHGVSAVGMLGAGFYGMMAGNEVSFGILFALYALGAARQGGDASVHRQLVWRMPQGDATYRKRNLAAP